MCIPLHVRNAGEKEEKKNFYIHARARHTRGLLPRERVRRRRRRRVARRRMRSSPPSGRCPRPRRGRSPASHLAFGPSPRPDGRVGRNNFVFVPSLPTLSLADFHTLSLNAALFVAPFPSLDVSSSSSGCLAVTAEKKEASETGEGAEV